MSSILDKYRAGVLQEREAHRPEFETLEGHPYKAFESASIPQRRLDLRPGYDAQRIVPYGYITEIFYAGDFMLDLEFNGYPLHVAIRGRNLGDLIAQLREERVVYIAEFIPEWHKQPDEAEAFIESLTITKPGRSDAKRPAKH